MKNAFQGLLFILALSLCALAQVPVIEPSTDKAVEKLSLAEAVKLAQRQNLQVRRVEAEIGELQEVIAASRTHRLPSFSVVNESYLPLGRFSLPLEFGGNAFPMRVGNVLSARAEQPITNFWRVNLEQQRAQLRLTMAEARLRAQRHAVANQVRQAWQAVLITESSLEKVRADLRLYREIERMTTEYVVQQVALKADGLEAKARAAEGEYEELALRNTLLTQQEQLNLLLGRAPRTPLQLADTADALYELPGEVNAVVQRALAQRPELNEARLRVRESETETRLRKFTRWPVASFFVQSQHIRGLNLQFAPPDFFVTGLHITWEPFDWGRRRRDVAATQKATEQQRFALLDLERHIASEVRARYLRVQEAAQLWRVKTLMRDALAEGLRVATLRVQERAALPREAFQAQAAYAEAVTKQQQAQRSYWIAVADFEKAMGADQ